MDQSQNISSSTKREIEMDNVMYKAAGEHTESIKPERSKTSKRESIKIVYQTRAWTRKVEEKKQEDEDNDNDISDNNNVLHNINNSSHNDSSYFNNNGNGNDDYDGLMIKPSSQYSRKTADQSIDLSDWLKVYCL